MVNHKFPEVKVQSLKRDIGWRCGSYQGQKWKEKDPRAEHRRTLKKSHLFGRGTQNQQRTNEVFQEGEGYHTQVGCGQSLQHVEMQLGSWEVAGQRRKEDDNQIWISKQETFLSLGGKANGVEGKENILPWLWDIRKNEEGCKLYWEGEKFVKGKVRFSVVKGNGRGRIRWKCSGQRSNI